MNQRPTPTPQPNESPVAASGKPGPDGQARWRLGFLQAPRKAVRITGFVLALAVVSVLVFAGYWAWRLQSNMVTRDLGAGGTKTEGAVNDRSDRLQILILGTDTRSGRNGQFGSVDQSSGYGQSDVMMLLDISADNQRVNVISMPRDLLVDVPACTDTSTGKQYPERPHAMINSAMAQAGVGCAVETVNKLTGLEVDHFMLADFQAVKELSNTVGGVQVCVNTAVRDPDSGLNLPKGTSQIQGDQALAFLRTRHAFTDGGDLGRIKAQQAFLASLTRKLKAEGTLSNPQKLLTVADTVTKNLTVDKGLASIPTLLTIADRLKSIDLAKVNFITVPNVPAASDPNRLDLDQPAASAFFAALKRSPDLTSPNPKDSTSATAAPTPAPTQGYDKSLQPVNIANGSSVTGRSNAIATMLVAHGFTNTTRSPAPARTQTMIYYGAGYSDVATDIATIFGLPMARTEQIAGFTGIQVYAGEDFATGEKPATPATGPSNVVAQTAQDQPCQATNPDSQG